MNPNFDLMACPIPISEYPVVTLAHGGGGRLMHQLIDKMFLPAFSNPQIAEAHDGAVLKMPPGRVAMSTDSYVVRPLFFPGGNIGDLAINGTVNDIAMCGARPLFLSAGFIIEEGFPMEDLWKIIQSMKKAAEIAGVSVVTGDTKVVDHGRCDGIYINTTGVGVLQHDLVISPRSVQAGDVILLNGDVGRHAMAIMAQRENLEFETTIESDTAALHQPILEMINAGVDMHCLRDCTRGGIITTTIEIAKSSGFRIELDEKEIDIQEDVRGACEILGLDALYAANEGRMILFIAKKDQEKALEILRKYPCGEKSKVVGKVGIQKDSLVILKTVLGTNRVMEMHSGEQLPRIC